MFKIVYASEEGEQQFCASMHSFGITTSPTIVAAFDLSRFAHLVDVGGGTGHLAVAACQRYPALRATVLDLPGVLKNAKAYVDKTPEKDRVDMLALDMFDDNFAQLAPKSVDIFALSRILHDWDEETCVKILKTLNACLPSGGCVLLAEKLLDEDKMGPLSAQLQSLNMLVQTLGKERTALEYGVLLGRAGFRLLGSVRTDGYLDAVLAEKTAS